MGYNTTSEHDWIACAERMANERHDMLAALQAFLKANGHDEFEEEMKLAREIVARVTQHGSAVIASKPDTAAASPDTASKS
jgi:hypothetical protein